MNQSWWKLIAITVVGLYQSMDTLRAHPDHKAIPPRKRKRGSVAHEEATSVLCKLPPEQQLANAFCTRSIVRNTLNAVTQYLPPTRPHSAVSELAQTSIYPLLAAGNAC